MFFKFFSRMRSEGFSFCIRGSGGWHVFAWPCFWCPQPSATVRNRPCTTVVRVKLPCRGKPQKRVSLDVSEDVLMSFCVAGVALCDIRRVWGGMCVRGRREGKVAVSIREATKTYLSRRVRRCAHVILRGRRGALWHLTCVRRNVCVRGLRGRKVGLSMGEATKTCLSRRVRRCAHVVLRGRRGALWHLTNFDDIWRVWGGMCVCGAVVKVKVAVSLGEATKTCHSPRVRRCAHVVLRGRRGTLWHSTCVRRNVCARPSWQKSCRVFGGSHKNVSFSTCQKMCSCRFAWQAWRFVTFDVCEEECVCAAVVRVKLPCLWGKPQKRIFLDVSEDVLMSFCVAGMALCTFDVCEEECVCAAVVRVKLPCLWGKPQKCVLLDVSEDVLMSFCVAGVALCDIRRVWGGMCVRGRREGKVAVSMGEATKTCLSRRVRRCAHVVLRGRRGALWHSTCVRRNVCARPSWG